MQEEVSEATTSQYRAPELVNLYSRYQINQAVDVFAFGVVLYRLMYKLLPFPDNEQLANFNCKYKFRDDLCKYSDALKQLVVDCLKQNPKDRPNVFRDRKSVV